MTIFLSLLVLIFSVVAYAISTNGKVQAISLALVTGSSAAFLLQVGGIVKFLSP